MLRKGFVWGRNAPVAVQYVKEGDRIIVTKVEMTRPGTTTRRETTTTTETR